MRKVKEFIKKILKRLREGLKCRIFLVGDDIMLEGKSPSEIVDSSNAMASIKRMDYQPLEDSKSASGYSIIVEFEKGTSHYYKKLAFEYIRDMQKQMIKEQIPEDLKPEQDQVIAFALSNISIREHVSDDIKKKLNCKNLVFLDELREM